jgi:hypothetical protein
MRLLWRLWRIIVDQMEHDLAAEFANAVAAEVEIVEAHRLSPNEKEISHGRVCCGNLAEVAPQWGRFIVWLDVIIEWTSHAKTA